MIATYAKLIKTNVLEKRGAPVFKVVVGCLAVEDALR
jgi:hypothetical protein